MTKPLDIARMRTAERVVEREEARAEATAKEKERLIPTSDQGFIQFLRQYLGIKVKFWPQAKYISDAQARHETIQSGFEKLRRTWDSRSKGGFIVPDILKSDSGGE
jgi:hypothetical protein